MKKVLIVVFAVLLMAGIASAKEFEIDKKAGGYTINIKIDNNPPIVGDNVITIAIKDPSGKNVDDAKVTVDYTMPAMSGMPAMNYKANAPKSGDGYKATMTLSMAGSWNVSVKVAHNHKTVVAKVNVDAK
ncbi:MAG: FixH family protein [Nitrospirae bacterium]|nr:FixH family protein [Nitrospirota bacterium]